MQPLKRLPAAWWLNMTWFCILADGDYEIHTASNGLEGLNKLHTAQRPYSLIISDQRMPMMSGVQFFTQAKDIFPDAVRILLTGYADTAAVIDAINKGGVHLYFTKPWHEEELLLHIKQSFSKVEILQENKRLIELIKKKNDELLELNKTLEKRTKDKTDDLLAQTEKLKDSYKKSQIILDGIVKTLSKIIEARDPLHLRIQATWSVPSASFLTPVVVTPLIAGTSIALCAPASPFLPPAFCQWRKGRLKARTRKIAICQRGVRSLGQNLPPAQPTVTCRE